MPVPALALLMLLASPRPSTQPDIGYLPTPQPAVEQMLKLAGVKPGERVYDLGCGDGRIVITAARRFGARGIGVELDPGLVRRARANVRRHGLGGRVEIRQADIFTIDFSDADVVALYLLPELNVRLLPQLRKLKPGARIVSFDFDMPGVPPAAVIHGRADGARYKIYKWVTPLPQLRSDGPSPLPSPR
jgi:SAM-dependent methyltransferase